MKNVQKYQLCCSPLMSTLFIVLACHWCLQASTKCKQQKIPVGCVYFNSTETSFLFFIWYCASNGHCKVPKTNVYKI